MRSTGKGDLIHQVENQYVQVDGGTNQKQVRGRAALIGCGLIDSHEIGVL